MHGLPPKPSLLTPRQIQTSVIISETLQEMPTTLSDLISEMATPDYSIATQELALNEQGEVIQNEKNCTSFTTLNRH